MTQNEKIFNVAKELGMVDDDATMPCGALEIAKFIQDLFLNNSEDIIKTFLMVVMYGNEVN